MRVLITGATGFLGSVVTRVLAEHGHRIRLVHRSSSRVSSVAPYAADVFVAEITDPVVMTRAADGMDAIVHVAGDLSHASSARKRVFRTNVIGTRIVAEAAKTAGVGRIVHTSSTAAVGYSPDGTPIDETAPNNFRPLNLGYHESKRLAEEELFDIRDYGVATVCLNPATLYGPRDLDHPFGHTMLELARGEIRGHPTGGLSLVDVDDVAAAYVQALTAGRDGERYILAGANLTYADAFRLQAEAAGATYRGRALPAWLLRGAAELMEARSRLSGRDPRLARDNVAVAPLRQWYRSDKAARELGYAARPIEATLARMAEAYRAKGLLQR